MALMLKFVMDECQIRVVGVATREAIIHLTFPLSRRHLG